MLVEAKQLIEEIRQIRIQYVAEVGTGRRAWPKSIKDRAAKLDDLGLPVKAISKECGISYDTLILWRYKRRHEVTTACPSLSGSGFHEISVSENGISKSVSVTVPKIEMPRPPVVTPRQEEKLGSLRVTTPNGFVIEGLHESSLASLLRSLAMTMGGDHAF